MLNNILCPEEDSLQLQIWEAELPVARGERGRSEWSLIADHEKCWTGENSWLTRENKRLGKAEKQSKGAKSKKLCFGEDVDEIRWKWPFSMPFSVCRISLEYKEPVQSRQPTYPRSHNVKPK